MKRVQQKNTQFNYGGNVIYLTPADFDIEMTYDFTAAGTIDIYMPAPGSVEVNKSVYMNFTGLAKPQIHPFSTEELDGQNATGTPLLWIVPCAVRLGTFVPTQKFSIISDSTNWQLKTTA